MKDVKFFAIAPLFLAGSLVATAKSKTVFPEKIDPTVVNQKPYRYNGVVLVEGARGSGFCAWNQRTFFSAAHVVYTDSGWGAPPLWLPKANSASVDASKALTSRGYYRLRRYAEIVEESGESSAFGRDVILAFAFKNVIPEAPAKLNLNGASDLRTNVSKLITGYPAVEDYTDTSTEGFFLHQTGPFNKPYSSSSDGALETTRISTGPGNSGGPIWTLDPKSGWKAAGILVGGLPSENVVYTFSSDINSLTRAVQPVIEKKQQNPIHVKGVSASSLFFPYDDSRKIPDGTESWSSYTVGVHGFDDDAGVKSVKLSLTIRTKHRGDLQVLLVGPGGVSALLHNEQGADANDLIYKDLDVSESFAGINPDGKWAVRVRDRLKGDIAILKDYRLEISAEEGITPAPAP